MVFESAEKKPITDLRSVNMEWKFENTSTRRRAMLGARQQRVGAPKIFGSDQTQRKSGFPLIIQKKIKKNVCVCKIEKRLRFWFR